MKALGRAEQTYNYLANIINELLISSLTISTHFSFNYWDINLWSAIKEVKRNEF